MNTQPKLLKLEDYLSASDFKSLYKSDSTNGNLENYKKPSALREALTIIIHKDNVKLLQKMVSKNLDVNFMFRRGQTLLAESIYQKSPNIFKYLLEQKANPDLARKTEHLPLMVAISEKRYDCFAPLLKSGANPHFSIVQNPNIVDGPVWYLHNIIWELPNFVNLFNTLIAHNYDIQLIHKKNIYGNTLLGAAFDNYKLAKQENVQAIIDCAKTKEELQEFKVELSAIKHARRNRINDEIFAWAETYMSIKQEQLLLNHEVQNMTKNHDDSAMAIENKVKFKI